MAPTYRSLGGRQPLQPRHEPADALGMTDYRAEFDAEVTFRNGGGLQAQGFRLDIPDPTSASPSSPPRSSTSSDCS
jgi:hypothetical protein